MPPAHTPRFPGHTALATEHIAHILHPAPSEQIVGPSLPLSAPSELPHAFPMHVSQPLGSVASSASTASATATKIDATTPDADAHAAPTTASAPAAGSSFFLSHTGCLVTVLTKSLFLSQTGYGKGWIYPDKCVFDYSL